MRVVETLTIGDHTFKQVRVDGSEIGAAIARMSRGTNLKRVYLRKEGGRVITGVPLPARPADLVGLGRAGDAYVLIVEERGIPPEAP